MLLQFFFMGLLSTKVTQDSLVWNLIADNIISLKLGGVALLEASSLGKIQPLWMHHYIYSSNCWIQNRLRFGMSFQQVTFSKILDNYISPFRHQEQDDSLN